MKSLELIGKRFGRLLIIKKLPCTSKKKSSRWLAKCDCGNEVQGNGNYIKNRTECEKCSRGVVYKDIKELEDGSVSITVPSKKYGDCYIIVDKEDLEKTVSFWWNIVKPKKVFYAQAWCRFKDNGQRKGGKLHQLIMGFPKGIIDHKNRNGLDNRKSNLRMATPSQSGANTSLNIDSRTGFKGVSYIPHKNLYCVQLRKDGKLVTWKRFKNILLAANHYNILAKQYFGEFASLNEFTEEQLKEIANPPKETRSINKNNLTGYIGVSKRKIGGGNKPYIATIYFDGKNKGLGVFKTAKEAALAYNKAAKIYKGEKASLNIIE